METLDKDNELIARFMGAKVIAKYPDHYLLDFLKEPPDNWSRYWGSNTLKYSKSWDWLIPVLERIETLGYKWEIGMSVFTPYHYCRIWSIGFIEGISPLDASFRAVVEFIKWYNKQNANEKYIKSQS